MLVATLDNGRRVLMPPMATARVLSPDGRAWITRTSGMIRVGDTVDFDQNQEPRIIVSLSLECSLEGSNA